MIRVLVIQVCLHCKTSYMDIYMFGVLQATCCGVHLESQHWRRRDRRLLVIQPSKTSLAVSSVFTPLWSCHSLSVSLTCSHVVKLVPGVVQGSGCCERWSLVRGEIDVIL